VAKKGRQNKVSKEVANPNVNAHAQDAEFAGTAKREKRNKK
jgi:hypothetical protein